MTKNRVFLRLGITLIFLLAVVHTIIHYSAFYSSSPSISGFVISDSVKKANPQIPYLSFSILGIEWLFLITMVIFSLVRQRIEIGTQQIHYNIQRAYGESASKTDLDVLYELIKNYGSIRISDAAKLFNVDDDKILEWCNILETADLISVSYPQMGEPVLMLKK